MTPQDLYATGRPPLIKTAVLGTLLTAICVSIADITGASTITKLALIALALAVIAMCEIYLYRRWQKHTERPALLRKNLAQLLRTDLPPTSTVASGHTFGRLLSPGPAKRIRITQPGMPPVEGDLAQKVLYLTGEIYQNEYVLSTKKSIPGKRIVLVQKPQEKQVQLTPTEQVEETLLKAAKEIFRGTTPKAEFDWDQESDEPYLLGVTITEVNGMDLALPGKRRQILIRLRTRLPHGNFVSEVYPNEDTIVFERSRPLPSMVVPPAEHAPLLSTHETYQEFFIPLGVGNNGEQAVWHPRKDAHCLFIGGTGGGKTIAEHGVIQRLAQAGARVWLIDGKEIEFIGYRDWPNIEFLAQDIDAQIRVLKFAHETMKARYKLIKQGKVRIRDLDPIFLVIDEVTSLLSAIKSRYLETKVKGMPSAHPALDWLSDLARLSRSSKMHLLYGLQRPDAAIMGGENRDNFGARASYGPLKSRDASMMIWDDPAVGMSVPNIKGRGVSVINGVICMMQGTYTANPDPHHDDYHHGMVEAMRPQVEIHSRKTIAEVLPEETEDGEVTWKDIIEAQVIDQQGQPIDFDPVASEESRAMRRTYRYRKPTEASIHLQAVETFQDGLDLFPSPTTKSLTYGSSLAKHLAHLAEELQPMRAEQNHNEAGSQEVTLRTDESEQGTLTELRYVEPGQSILIDGNEEIGVGSCEPDSEDPSIYHLTGWTTSGEEIHLALPADSPVETFDLERV